MDGPSIGTKDGSGVGYDKRISICKHSLDDDDTRWKESTGLTRAAEGRKACAGTWAWTARIVDFHCGKRRRMHLWRTESKGGAHLVLRIGWRGFPEPHLHQKANQEGATRLCLDAEAELRRVMAKGPFKAPIPGTEGVERNTRNWSRPGSVGAVFGRYGQAVLFSRWGRADL